MTSIPSHIYRTLIRESFWLFLGIAGFTSVVLLDAWFIGRVGTQELIAVGFAGPVLIGCLNLLLALGTGITATIAPLIGQKRPISYSLFLTIGGLVGAGLAVILWLSWEQLFQWMRAPQDLVVTLAPYIYAYLPGLPVMGILTAQISILRSWSSMKDAAIVLMVLCVVNAGLDPLLMFPAGLNLSGAAWATTIAAVCAVFTALFLLRKNDQPGSKDATSRKALLRTVASVALPAAALRSLLPFATVWILRWISSIDPDFAGAYGVGQRVDLFIMMLPLAISSVASPRIGRSWGEGEGVMVRRWVNAAVHMVLVYGLLALGCLTIFGRMLAHIWGADDFFTEDLILYFHFMSFAFAGQGVFQIVQNSFYALQRARLSVIWSCVQVLIWLLIGGIAFKIDGGISWILVAWPVSLTLAATGAYLHWQAGPGKQLSRETSP